MKFKGVSWAHVFKLNDDNMNSINASYLYWLMLWFVEQPKNDLSVDMPLQGMCVDVLNNKQ